MGSTTLTTTTEIRMTIGEPTHGSMFSKVPKTSKLRTSVAEEEPGMEHTTTITMTAGRQASILASVQAASSLAVIQVTASATENSERILKNLRLIE